MINPVATANRACALLYSFIKKHSDGTYLLPVNVCPDVPLTFCLANVPFEFVDIDVCSLCIDHQLCLERIKAGCVKYAGLVYVRTYGYMCDTTEFFAQLHHSAFDFQIIDDRCLCIPEINPNLYGADMVLYSTGYCKQIDLGGGGLAYYARMESFNIDSDLIYDGTDEVAIYKEAYRLNIPLTHIPTGWLEVGKNKQATQSYLKTIKESIPDRLRQREKLNYIYSTHIPKELQLSKDYQSWRFHIRVPSHLKDQILTTLFNNGLFASSHYHSVNYLFGHGIFNNSDSLFASVINLFNDKHYTREKAEETCNLINRILESIPCF